VPGIGWRSAHDAKIASLSIVECVLERFIAKTLIGEVTAKMNLGVSQTR
jgi:hypothetical protein